MTGPLIRYHHHRHSGTVQLPEQEGSHVMSHLLHRQTGVEIRHASEIDHQ